VYSTSLEGFGPSAKQLPRAHRLQTQLQLDARVVTTWRAVKAHSGINVKSFVVVRTRPLTLQPLGLLRIPVPGQLHLSDLTPHPLGR
jgi:hypothetical protein